MKINWKQKLSSRKLWAMAAGLITSILLLLKVESSTVAEIGAIVIAIGSIVSYIVGESYVDGQREANRQRNGEEHTDAIGYTVNEDD